MSIALLRWSFWGLVGLCVIGGVAYALRPQPIIVDTESIASGVLEITVMDDGMTRIRERYVISSPMSAQLMRVPWDVGDSVVAGQTVLANLQAADPSLLDARAVAQAKARVSAAERRLEVAKAELSKSEAILQFAEQELGRVRRLFESNAASVSGLQEAESLFQARTEDVRASGIEVDIAQYELELERAAFVLTQPAPNPSKENPRTMELPIVSPINGRVLRLYQESSAVVSAGAQLLEVGDPTDLEVVVDVLSQDAVRINPGDRVRLRNWGGDQPLEGRVRRIEPSGFTKTSALGVEEQRVNVIIDFVGSVEARLSLGDNFRVDAEVIVSRQDGVLLVPTSALFRLKNEWFVFQVIAGKAARTKVSIGAENGSHAEVLDGLKPSDEVVVYPGDAIDDGVRVVSRSSFE